MSGQPFVTVVIPTFNHAKLLRRALDSLVAQTFDNWEAIVINNFSTDETIQVVESFQDDRIKLINFKNNGVIAASRNQGIKIARGNYIAFLDSDDCWYSEKLQKCVECTNRGAKFICHGELWINGDLSTREIMYGPANRATYLSLLFRGNCISTSATLVNKKVLEQLGGFSENPSFITAEDYELWIRISRTTTKFVFIHEILGEFRRHDKSASSSVDKHLAAEIAVINHHVEQIHPSFMVFIRARHRRAKAFYSAGRTHMRGGSTGLALSFFTRALLQSPIFFRTYVAITLTLINLFRRKSK